MSTPSKNIPYYTATGRKLTPQEEAFIESYVKYKNATLAVQEAGYRVNPAQRAQRGRALLDRDYIREEVKFRLDSIKSRTIATATEVLQFYTSVMRGEILDQFGIEASLDTRIKAANELAKHTIEIPMKLQQQKSNSIGSIQINFKPREIKEETES